MNKRIKKLWIDALRSGKYEQAKNRLRSDGAFCCLGVLCDIHARSGEGAEWRDGRYLNKSGVLPSVVVEWAALPDCDPIVGRSTLSQLNDRGRDFNFIADRIEKYL